MSERIRSVQESALRQSLIEVVAKALFATAWDGYKTWDTTNDYGRDPYLFDAAAVVDALGVECEPATKWLKHPDANGKFVPYEAPLYRIKALES